MSDSLVNQSGTIANLVFLGFTILTAFGELIDNSNDAGGKKVMIGLFKRLVDGVTEYYYYIADDATGMTKRKLSQSFNINNHNKEHDLHSKSGRFGVGGSASLNTISKKPGNIQKITRCDESRQLYAAEVDYDVDETLPSAHNASKDQEDLWAMLSVNPNGTGTVIIGRIDEENYMELEMLLCDNTTSGLKWYIANTYCRKIENGIAIGIKSDPEKEEIIIKSFDPSASSLNTDEIIREKHDIVVLTHAITREIIFAVAEEDGSYWSLQLKKDRIRKAVPTQLDLSLYGKISKFQHHKAYSSVWDKIHDEMNSSGNRFEKGKIPEFKRQTLGRGYIRSNRVITHIPRTSRNQGDKAAYSYWNETTDEIIMDSDKTLDTLFGVQVNKSQLDEKKIHPEIIKLLNHLCNEFSNKIWKNTSEYTEIQKKKKKKTTKEKKSGEDEEDSENENGESGDHESDSDNQSTISCVSASPSQAGTRKPITKLVRNLMSTSDVAVTSNLGGCAGGGGGAAAPSTSTMATEAKIDDVVRHKETIICPHPPSPPSPPSPPPPSQQISAAEDTVIVSTIPSYTSRRITRSTGERYIQKLYESQHPEIEETITEMIRGYYPGRGELEIANEFLDIMLPELPEGKKKMLLFLIQKHHASPDDFLRGGSRLYNVYHSYFPE
jgi:hypothetical protein